MNKITGTLYTIEWRGYYHLSDGCPRVLAELFTVGHSGKVPSEIAEFPYSLGGGYSLTVTHVPYPNTPMKTEALSNIRQKRAERRIRAKTPLFAEQFLKIELERKPDYYAGITDKPLEDARKEVLAEEWRRYNDLMSRPGKLIVHAQEPEECKQKAEALRKEIEEIRRTHQKCNPE